MEPRSAKADSEESLSIFTFKGNSTNKYNGIILARWLRSFRHLNPEFKLMDQAAYYQNYESFLKALLIRPQTHVSILALTEDPDVVFGWCVYEPGVLHYVHIQEPYRGQKRSYDLIPKDIHTFTHRTKHFTEKLWKKRFKHLKYNPFL